jgi:S-adenosylmethionine:tRNA ribosyltransferase-isomerase
MHLSEFDYQLPDELIAQEPLADRSASRMLVVYRSRGVWEDRAFSDLPSYLRPDDCLVLNDTKVFPSRLFGKKFCHDRQMELFLLKPLSADHLKWLCLARPGRHLRPGSKIYISPGLSADIIDTGPRGERIVRFTCSGDIREELAAAGHVPLPPYIHRTDEPKDKDRYQTVYASNSGSVAAPTAGLHFTPEVLERCRQAGASIAHITLHVGLGTFQPLKEEQVELNELHTESYAIPEQSVPLLQQAKRRIAVGTTSARTLETVAASGGFSARQGETKAFIYPGYQFLAVNALLTNFHLPQSSLMLLVCAFGGKELMLAAYRHAVEQRYRFFSYGDCMLIL